MSGSKEIMTKIRPNLNEATVTYGDRSKSEVLGFGKVVIARDITLVNVMLVKSLGYNLLSVHLIRWVSPSFLILMLWYSCGARL